MLPIRFCLDVQVDNMRRRRIGEKGLVRSRAAARELGSRLGVPDPVTDGCSDGTLEPRSWRAGARWAVATRLTTRVVCPPPAAGSFHWRDVVTNETVEDTCYEDHVELSVSVLDESGAPGRTASVEVEAADAAPARVRHLLTTLRITARGSVSLPGQCTEANLLLDCTNPGSSTGG